MSESSSDLRLRALARLVPPAVHKLNNSLAVLRGIGEISGSSESVELVRRSQRAYDLLECLSVFSKEHPPATETTDLSRVLDSVQTLVEHLFMKMGVDLRVDSRPPAGCPSVVRAEASFLTQLLSTLLVGALPEQEGDRGACHLDLGLARKGEQVCVRMEHSVGMMRHSEGDTLVNWAQSQAEQIGAALQRSEDAPDGETWELALDLAEPPPALVEEPEDQDRSARSLHVLLVEDERALGELMRDVMREAGHQVQWVTGLNAAVHALEGAEGRPDLVLLDADGTPDDGSVPKELSASSAPTLYRFGVTGLADHRALRKPIRPVELLEFLKSC